MEERLLVKRAKRGDVDAFGELYGQIYKKLYAYALYTLGRPADAEDVVSEAVADAFSTIHKLRKEESFASWMYQIVANKCNRRMREYYRQTEELVEEQSGQMKGAMCDAHRFEENKENQIELCQAMEKLSVEERRIVNLHVVFGYTTKEIADQLQMNENTIRSKEHRALKKLAQMLAIE